MIIKVSINDLKKGHFVVDIVEQQGTYNLARAGHIKSNDIILGLQAKGVNSVLIDTTKTIDEALKTNLPEQLEKSGPLILEVAKAKNIFKQSKQIQQQILLDAQQNRPIDLAPIIEVTNHIITAIFKNPDALVCVINIRDKSQYLLEHSVSVLSLIHI